MLVVFSDGRDTTSWLTSEDAERMVSQSEAVVFAVMARPPARSPREPFTWAVAAQIPDAEFLRTLTESSGGRLITVKKHEDLVSAFEKALMEMRSRYILYYRPTGVDRPGFHKLEVALAGRSANVRARPGYYVPPSPER